MKVVKPGYEIILNTLDPVTKIERVARVCYKSESKIKEGSAEKLVSALIKRGHEAMLEHASFCFELDGESYLWLTTCVQCLQDTTNFKSYLTVSADGRLLVSGNVRAWRSFLLACVEIYKFFPEFIKQFIFSNPVLFPELQDENMFAECEGVMIPITDDQLRTKNEKLKHFRPTVQFIVDRGVSHEIVRHRAASFAQESTRYCNYMKDDFGGEIAVIKPFYLEEGTIGYSIWEDACRSAETAYFDLLNWGCTAQEARGVLPTHLKTEVVMTAPLSEWVHFFNLRALGTTGAPHPQMKEVAEPLLEAVKTDWLDFDYAEGKDNG